MSFVSAAERDEVACTLATLILADSGVKVDAAGIEKVGAFCGGNYAIALEGCQHHC